MSRRASWRVAWPLLPWALAILAGVLLAMSYAMHPVWWAAWLAPAPALAAAALARAGRRRAVTLLTGLIAGVSSLSYHATVGGWPVAFLILTLVALAWSSAIRLAMILFERNRAGAAVLAIPIIWAAIDTLLIHVSPHGSAGSIAYSQADMLPVAQAASVGGIPAVTFLTLLGGSVAGLLALVLIGRGPAAWRVAALIGGVCVGGAVLFGMLRPEALPATGMPVALVATDRLATTPADPDAFLSFYGPAIAAATRPGGIVALPEAVARLDAPAAERLAERLSEMARNHEVTIVAGVIVETNGVATNRALVATSDGRHRWYLKRHMVPGIEADLTPGAVPLLFRSGESTVGVAICKDMHFPALGLENASAGAGLMIVPANDFEVDDWLTARMTMMRGVESGMTIVRATRHGISFVSDRYGRMLAERRSDREMSMLTAIAPTEQIRPTLYSIVGDLFGWLCVVAWAALLALRYWPSLAAGRAPTS